MDRYKKLKIKKNYLKIPKNKFIIQNFKLNSKKKKQIWNGRYFYW